MRSAEFEALRRGVEGGGEHFVEDRATRMVGKVVGTREGNLIVVQVDGDQQTWPAASCREKWGYTKH